MVMGDQFPSALLTWVGTTPNRNAWSGVMVAEKPSGFCHLVGALGTLISVGGQIGE